MFFEIEFSNIGQDLFHLTAMSRDHEKLRAAAIVESIDERHISTEEATEKQLRKGVNAAQTTARKGKTPAGKAEKCCKAAGDREKTSSNQAPSMAGNQAAKRTATASSCNLVEEMDEIKQQPKQLSGSLASITPMITEIKTPCNSYNQAVDGDIDAHGSKVDLASTVSSV